VVRRKKKKKKEGEKEREGGSLWRPPVSFSLGRSPPSECDGVVRHHGLPLRESEGRGGGKGEGGVQRSSSCHGLLKRGRLFLSSTGRSTSGRGKGERRADRLRLLRVSTKVSYWSLYPGIFGREGRGKGEGGVLRHKASTRPPTPPAWFPREDGKGKKKEGGNAGQEALEGRPLLEGEDRSLSFLSALP